MPSFAKDALTFTLSTGTKVPWIAYGTGTALYNKPAAKHVEQALDVGFTHIDTAESYANEDSTGEGIAEYLKKTGKPRESIFVTTKLAGPQPGKTTKELLQESLRKLKLTYVDLYLIHTPRPLQGKLKEIWKDFEALKKEGLAKEIGVSNFRVADFNEFIDEAEIKPAVNQIEFNPYLLKAATPLLELHEKYGILTTSFGGLIPVSRKTGGELDSEILPAIAKRLGNDATESQVLIKWTLAKNVLPVTTSSKKSRLENLLQTHDLADLTAEEIAQIDAAGAKLHHRVYQQHMDS